MWVKRTDGSSYFPPSFEALERQALESIAGVQYLSVNQPIPEQGDICLITNTHTDLTKWLPVKNRVSFILHPNSGHDNLNRVYEQWNDVPIVLGHEIRAAAVAEWTMAALLQQGSFLRHHSSWPTTREWPRQLLKDRRTLLIGFGPVGFSIAHRLRAMDVNVEIHDPWRLQETNLAQKFSTVILAASLNPTSRHIINREFLKHMADDVLIVNGARGELIDEQALRDFLKTHPQARAVLDVHAQEPYQAGYWDDTPQVIATPHVAGVWSGLIPSMIDFEQRTLKTWLSDQHEELAFLSERVTDEGFIR